MSIWLADVAANVLCVVIVLLVLAGLTPRAPGPEAVPLPLVAAAPMGSAEAVEMLRARLRDAPGRWIDLAAEGATEVATPGPVRVYVFSPEGHADLVRRLEAAGLTWRELAVPEALRRADGGGFSAEFLALAPLAEDPDAFRRALARLLASGGGRAEAEGAGSDAAARLAQLGQAVQALLALLAVALVLTVWRLGRRRRVRS